MLRTIYFTVFVVLAGVYYYAFGPAATPSEAAMGLPWWQPRGWAKTSPGLSAFLELARTPDQLLWIPIAIFCTPIAALMSVGYALFRSTVSRSLLLALALTTSVLVAWGFIADGAVWRFFGWRFPVTATCLSVMVSLWVYAPSLLGKLLAPSRRFAALILLLCFVSIFLLSTEITGTNVELPLNLSPWPVLTVFGLLFFGFALSAIHLAGGIGIMLWSMTRNHSGIAFGVLSSLFLGIGFAYLFFEEPAAGLTLAAGVLCAVITGITIGRSFNHQRATELALHRIAAGILLAAMIAVSNSAALAYQSKARNQTAEDVIAALGAFQADDGGYPGELEELVPHYLAQIPHARMGLLLNGDEFIYSNFGDSFALEFASVQWVQCSYSPPYIDDDADEDWEEEAVDDLNADADEFNNELEPPTLSGSWNCATAPPDLW